MPDISFPAILSELRRERRLTQAEVAEYFGVSRSCIANWEKGIRTPSLRIMKELAVYFDVSYAYLMDGMEAVMQEINLSLLNDKGLQLMEIYFNDLLKQEKYRKTQ